mgnify:CR=1 FL=1
MGNPEKVCIKQIFSALALAALAACGGGGSSGGSGPVAPVVTPTLTPVPIGNTSLAFYLPLAAGNSWTFATGGKLVDAGSGPLVCTCPGNGYKMEQVQAYAPSSATVSASFFFTKNTPTGGSQLTNIVGVENDANTNNITIMSSTQFPYGIPLMDDAPLVGEKWTDGAGDTSTITSVGGTTMLPSGTQIINIANDQITGPTFSALSFSLAKGVGFTQIGVGSNATNMVSFSVGASSSSVVRRPSSLSFRGAIGIPKLKRAFLALFPR